MSSEKQHIGFMDVLIVALLLAATIFVVAMIISFRATGMEQTSLIAAVFALITFELRFMYKIKIKKLEGEPEAQAMKETADEEFREDDMGENDTVDNPYFGQNWYGMNGGNG